MFYKGDIVMFNDIKPKKINFLHRFFKKIYVELFGCVNEHHSVYSYSIFKIDDLSDKNEYELNNGDMYIVDSYYLSFMSITPLNVNIKKCLYYTNCIRNFRSVTKSEYTKILRKEKIQKLNNI